MDHQAQVIQLLTTHGPATAYAYMEQHGLSIFPSRLVDLSQQGIWATLERHQQKKVDIAIAIRREQ